MVDTIKVVEGEGSLQPVWPKPKLLQMGRLRAYRSLSGGFWIEIAGDGQARRAELSPRDTVRMAVEMLRIAGVEVNIEIERFRQ